MVLTKDETEDPVAKAVRLVAEKLNVNEADVALLRAVATGDAGAFKALHKRYYAKAYGFALRVVQAPDRADEIANDAMLAIWRGADKFEGRAKVSSWIFGIVYRMALKSRRRFWFERSHVELDDTLGLADEATPGVEAIFARQEISGALATLTVELRAIVELTYREGLSYPEIAEIVGCPIGTVKSRMSSARQKMRKHLERNGT